MEIIKYKSREGRDHVREKARARDGYKCMKCGRKQASNERRFDVHHLEGCGQRTQEYEKDIELLNLITLCHFCHTQLLHIYQKSARRLTQEKRDKVKRLRLNNISIRKIADQVDLSYPVVQRCIKRLNIKVVLNN